MMEIIAFSRRALMWALRAAGARVLRVANDGKVWRAEVVLGREARRGAAHPHHT